MLVIRVWVFCLFDFFCLFTTIDKLPIAETAQVCFRSTPRSNVLGFRSSFLRGPFWLSSIAFRLTVLSSSLWIMH
jgi:hypothetical protein